jgi:hypothetical protein
MSCQGIGKQFANIALEVMERPVIAGCTRDRNTPAIWRSQLSMAATHSKLPSIVNQTLHKRRNFLVFTVSHL